eukprot:1879285-Amphidinium_carterae.1
MTPPELLLQHRTSLSQSQAESEVRPERRERAVAASFCNKLVVCGGFDGRLSGRRLVYTKNCPQVTVTTSKTPGDLRRVACGKHFSSTSSAESRFTAIPLLMYPRSSGRAGPYKLGPRR